MILCLVKKGTAEEVKKETSNKLISENIISDLLEDIKTKFTEIKVDPKENPRVAKLKDEYEFKLVNVKDFAAKQIFFKYS